MRETGNEMLSAYRLKHLCEIMATPTTILLKTFDAAIAEKILPFFASLDAQHLVGESCHDSSVGPSSLKLKPYAQLDGRFFWWVNRFIVGKTTLDIGYGDREFTIETFLFYDGIKDHFAAWELLSAAEVPRAQIIFNGTFVCESDFMVRIIDELAQGLRQHWNIINTPTPQLINRALEMRVERIKAYQQEQRRRELERAMIRASTAFHAGHYDEAKKLLEPFKQDAELTPSAAKILELVQKKPS